MISLQCLQRKKNDDGFFSVFDLSYNDVKSCFNVSAGLVTSYAIKYHSCGYAETKIEAKSCGTYDAIDAESHAYGFVLVSYVLIR